jgi:hypothetical protein
MDEEVQLHPIEGVGLTLEQFREFTKDLPGTMLIVPRFAIYPPDEWPAVSIDGFSVLREEYSDAPPETVLAVMISEHELGSDVDDDDEDEEDDEEADEE